MFYICSIDFRFRFKSEEEIVAGAETREIAKRAVQFRSVVAPAARVRGARGCAISEPLRTTARRAANRNMLCREPEEGTPLHILGGSNGNFAQPGHDERGKGVPLQISGQLQSDYAAGSEA